MTTSKFKMRIEYEGQGIIKVKGDKIEDLEKGFNGVKKKFKGVTL